MKCDGLQNHVSLQDALTVNVPPMVNVGLPMSAGMNVFPMVAGSGESRGDELVEIIDLKWLLAGLGWRLHVERLQSDFEYARRALEFAEASDSTALREAACRVRSRMKLAPV
jgi:hypothetical protein